MVEIIKKDYQGIPFIELFSKENMNKKLPLIFFYHGWDWDGKVLTQAYEIARKNFRVVIPEAIGFGRRSYDKNHRQFWYVVQHSIKEFTKLIQYYETQKKILDYNIGVGGLSMGGIISCCLFNIYPWIHSAICLEGTPSPLTLAYVKHNIVLDVLGKDNPINNIANLDLSLHPSNIKNRNLYFWNDIDDKIIPCQLTENFFNYIKNKNYAKNVTMKITEGKGHRVPMNITFEVVDKFVQFFYG